ncbi:zinc finger protein 41-like [Lutzomyia longipalpis]|uniref:zinc finger protein 41-like n=1 Tax=Lutzomyia longipalpis TaxID=7200 RepID=UPI00248389FC|nr:zinc finger protein 41-like [Lutzomyia longipalpis]
MEFVNVSGRCRACRIKTQKEFQIPIFATENLQLIFHEATSLEIHENDGLPGILCNDCYRHLLDAHKFRQMCASSAMEFYHILSEQGDSDFEEKYQPPEHVEKSSGSEVMFLQEEEFNLPEEKFNPISLVEAQFIQGERSTVEAEKRKRGPAKRGKKPADLGNGDPLGLLKDDDPDWTAKKTPKGRKQSKTPSKPRKPYKKREKKPRDDADPAIAGEAEDKPAVSASAGKTKRMCAICGKMYLHKANLKWHMRIVHQGLKEAKCEICNKEFTRAYSHATHMMVVHGNKKLLRCTECRVVFRTNEGFEKHQKEWHDPENPREKTRNFMCDLCGKAFFSNAALQRHTSSHLGTKPFQCTLCPKAYNRNHRLKVHMMRHEGIKNHVCTVCGLRKTTLTELKTHMNIHTKERVFSCKYCPKTFLKGASLTRHTKVVHQGIKAFNCPHCERSFGKKETLKHHVMTHTGEKPHGCNICGKRFIQPTALQTHMKTHQKMNLVQPMNVAQM